MKHIKNTLHLFRLDWHRLRKHPVAFLLVIALMILPSLYAWFNIKALWNPYENTADLPIAVYSDDVGASFSDEKIEIGEQVIDNLHDNKQLGWRFVKSEKELTNGVKSGKYFAGIYLPKEFSEDLLSFTKGEIHKPKIEYYVNQKINAIAPKITDKGASSIQSTISDEFINTASSTLMKVFNEIGFDLDSNLVSITKIESLIHDLYDNQDEIKGYADEIIALNGKMPEYKEKLALANEFTEYLPEVDALTQKVLDLNAAFPELKEKASIILEIEEKIPEIKNAGSQLAEIDNDFATIEKTMNDGISEAKDGLVLIQNVHEVLPDIETLINNSKDFVDLGEQGITDLQNKLPDNLNEILDTVIRALKLSALNVKEITENLSNLATTENQAEVVKGLDNLINSVSSQQQMLTNLANFLTYLAKNNPDLNQYITIVNNANSNLGVLKDRLSQIKEQAVAGNMDQVKQDLLNLSSMAQDIENSLEALDGTTISNDLSNALSKTLETLNAADSVLTKAQAMDLESFLTSTEKTVADAITLLEKYQAQLPEIQKEVHDANTLLNGHMDEIVSAIETGSDLYKNKLPTLEEKLQQGADFITNDWPGIKEDLTNTLKMVNDKFPQVEDALNMASTMIQEDGPMLLEGLNKADAALDKLEGNVDLGEIISLLKLDAQKESDFFTSPVELQTNAMYPMPNNGSASTPFYTALCLWVGALLLSSVATTDVYLEKEDKDKYSKREQFSARLLSFLTIGLFQGLIVSLGNLFLLHVYTVEPVLSVVFALVVALSFMAVVYMLAALFGNLGKGIAIIILVLSISGGGGNYPIQLSGKFFQLINPLLPFTHAVDLLREPAGGIYWPNVWPDFWFLTLLFVAVIVLGIVFYPRISRFSKKLAEYSHKSHFFH